MKGISEKEYRDYLIDLKDTIFKVLPLYEERNEPLDEYIDSLVCFELLGAGRIIQEHPHRLWYVRTLSTLRGIEAFLVDTEYPHPALVELTEESTELEIALRIELLEYHRRVRREILKTIALIDKQIDQLKGE